VPAERIADPRYVNAAQTIAGVELFDSELFQFTGDEAEILDPQHRVFLECALEALERAGYDPHRTEGYIGVYAGAGMNTYLLNNLGERYRAGSAVDRYRLMLANDKDFLATRVSYKLDLRGPSININTACSTSLVAVHTACLGLLSGECELALVGAVHLGLSQGGYEYQEGMIFSSDGHCRAFDSEARGTVIGSGVGVVILKRLEEALEDGDWIHAVIRGSAVNNDGSDKTGYSAPSISGQAAVIADALEVGSVEADSIGYVEAHGTGTPLGDPIEVAALTEAFRKGTNRTGFCALGSVKTNIGHLDTAAGVAGLIKTALMLEHGTLVPSLHFSTPNPEIDFAASPFFVSTKTTEWKAADGPRRAGVSSFGIGGTNAHVVLQEPPARAASPQGRDRELIVLSARSEAALRQATIALARHLKQNPDLELSAVAQTLGLGRRGRAHRLMVVARSIRDAAMVLALGDEKRLRHGVVSREPSAPVLVLTGARVDEADSTELYRSVPLYRTAVDACAAILARGAGKADGLLREGSAHAAFVHEYALATTLIAWGIAPAGLAATGSGLAVAAAVAEALTLEKALALAGGTAPGSVAVPRLPVLSLRTGRWMTEDESRLADSWMGGVDLSGLDGLLSDGGRHPVRLAPVDGESAGLNHLLALAGAEWVSGAELDFAAIHADREIRRVPLPTTPFERRPHWVEPGSRSTARAPEANQLITKLEAADEGQKVELVTSYMVEEIAKVLGDRERVRLDTNLFELGLDSLVLIGVTAKLAAELKFDVPASSFVEFPTIRSFVANLAELMGFGSRPEAGTNPSSGRLSRRAPRAAARHGGTT
jgi:acyl transferase domain-containing protein